MKIAYLDCNSGISGDMTLGALVDAGVDVAELNDAVASLGLEGCRLVAQEVRRRGFRARQVVVEYHQEHGHRHLHHIMAMIDRSRLDDGQRDLARRIFTRLAEAEARVHGIAVEKVHFHEVGAADSIADVVATAVGWRRLGIQRTVASPVPTGTGQIQIAHGLCSIPAPATAELLRGVPLAESPVPFELTTPTGAAILTTLADGYGPLPSMQIDSIGCGAGGRDLQERPNLLRLLIGQSASLRRTDQVWVLETNLDHISGELIGYCTGRLLDAGALDVYTTAIQMKKNRPGVKVSVLCEAQRLAQMEAILFEETTTLGVRRWAVDRRVLSRRSHQVSTDWGMVEGKLGWLPGEPPRFAPEFEACRRIAAANNVPLRLVYETAQKAFDPRQVKIEEDTL
jgi:pyridinium-3,5-bisthiocarboxylic acid mononucleotide nickel chelatase